MAIRMFALFGLYLFGVLVGFIVGFVIGSESQK